MENAIQVIDAEKYYSNGEDIFKAVGRISFNVCRGEFISIMESPGSGKTSLLNIIAGIVPVTSGHVIIDGKDISQMDSDGRAGMRRNNTSFIFQDYNLIDTLTIKENACLSLIMDKRGKKETLKKADEMLTWLGIYNIKDRYPYQVSGGQKQLCACARALISSPKYLFADEPSGALDTHSSVNLMEVFKTVNNKFQVTILMAAHNPVSASFSSRVLFLEKGKITYELYRGNKDNAQMLKEILNIQKI